MERKSVMEWINPLKGFTIFLVVIHHCLSGYFNAGLFKDFEIFLKPLNDYFAYFRMPVFFVISGFLFQKFYSNLLVKKFRYKFMEIGIFYFFYSTVLIITQIFLSKDVNTQVGIIDILKLPFKTVAPYWYLYILMVFYLLSYFVFKKITIMFLFASMTLSIVSNYLPYIEIFDISRCMYYFVFWVIGGYLCTSKVDLENCKILILVLLIVEVVLVYTGFVNLIPRTINALILTGLMMLAFASFRFLNQSNFCNYLGVYCLPIYLLHVYFTAGTRVVLRHLENNDFYVYILTGIVLGIVIPILIYKICSKYTFLNVFFKPIKFMDWFKSVKE